MTTFFLGCFGFGLIFTVASFLLGALGGAHHLHIPGLHLEVGGHGGADGAGAHAGGAGGAHAAMHGAGAHGGGSQSAQLSPFNFSTISAFLTWFGGAGYLLTRYSGFTAVLTLAVAGAAGLAGGGIIFVTLGRLVLPRLTEMRPEDYQLQGTVARVASAIGAGGTGEVVYTLAGTRRVDGARSVSGEALERGAEVVILRVERGIAYVERWDKFADKHQLPPGDSGTA